MAAETSGYKAALYAYDTSGIAALSVAFDGGNIKSYIGGTLTNVMAFSANTWYTIRAVVDTDTDQYDLYIDGEKKLTSSSLRNTVTNFGKVTFNIGKWLHRDNVCG
jgi:hypothetical protein